VRAARAAELQVFFEWLETTPWSIALLESFWVWPLLESTHVLTTGVFVGTAVMMDLRLLGVSFKTIPVSEFTGRMLPWTRGAFAMLAVTGLLIFYASPVRYYHNVFFRVKIALLIIGGLNVWWFHSRTHPSVGTWDRDPVPPRAARISGAVSLFVWLWVVITGRMIAYNWFDCDIQPQSDFTNWVSGCVLPPQ
jgi:hypothetical protein